MDPGSAQLNWFALAAAALWVFALALILAAFSWAVWFRARGDASWKVSVYIVARLGAGLFCIGWGVLPAQPLKGRVLWLGLAVVWAWSPAIQWLTNRADHGTRE
jgi:hypothetical protein